MLWVAILACNLPLGGPEVPTPRPVVTSDPGTGDWRSLVENAQPGDTLTITLTEADLTEVMADEVRANPDMNIQNPRVVLTNGIMQVFGQATMDVVTANFRVDIDVKVDDQGEPKVEIISADFGGIPVPDSMRQTLTERLNAAFQRALGSVDSRFRVSDITITEGQMKINGTVQ